MTSANDSHRPSTARILLVGDDGPVLDRIAEALARSGHVAIQEPSGAPAAERYRAHLPDIVLVDLDARSQSGLEATRDICAEFPDARVITMSGAPHLGNVDTREAARSAGALLFLEKSFTRGTLLASVDVVILMPEVSARRIARVPDSRG